MRPPGHAADHVVRAPERRDPRVANASGKKRDGRRSVPATNAQNRAREPRAGVAADEVHAATDGGRAEIRQRLFERVQTSYQASARFDPDDIRRRRRLSTAEQQDGLAEQNCGSVVRRRRQVVGNSEALRRSDQYLA